MTTDVAQRTNVAVSTVPSYTVEGLGSGLISSLQFIGPTQIQFERPISGTIDPFFANIAENKKSVGVVTIKLFRGPDTIRTITLKNLSIVNYSPMSTPAAGSHVSESGWAWEVATFSFDSLDINDTPVSGTSVDSEISV